LPNLMRVGGERVRPWAVLVTSRSDDLVLGHVIAVEEPGEAALWDALAEAMKSPVVGEPHRPARLEVPSDARWESLARHVEELGVELVLTDELDELDGVFESLGEHLVGEPPPGMLDAPGVTPERVAGFYEAAAGFFRQAPWKKVGYESAIRVECDRYQGGPWYAVLMGQSGL
jgi:hypothetical protein